MNAINTAAFLLQISIVVTAILTGTIFDSRAVACQVITFLFLGTIVVIILALAGIVQSFLSSDKTKRLRDVVQSVLILVPSVPVIGFSLLLSLGLGHGGC